MTNIQLAGTFYLEDCIYSGCGVSFAVTKEFNRRRRNDGKSFYCPNGHVMVYNQGASDEQKLRDAAARELALKDQLSAANRAAEDMRVSLLRDRARFANGVCPCCNRSFENVRRHMETKHADYDVTQVAVSTVKFPCTCGRSFGTLRGLRIHQGSQRTASWDESPIASARWGAHLTKVSTR